MTKGFGVAIRKVFSWYTVGLKLVQGRFRADPCWTLPTTRGTQPMIRAGGEFHHILGDHEYLSLQHSTARLKMDIGCYIGI